MVLFIIHPVLAFHLIRWRQTFLQGSQRLTLRGFFKHVLKTSTKGSYDVLPESWRIVHPSFPWQKRVANTCWRYWRYTCCSKELSIKHPKWCVGQGRGVPQMLISGIPCFEDVTQRKALAENFHFYFFPIFCGFHTKEVNKRGGAYWKAKPLLLLKWPAFCRGKILLNKPPCK